MRGRAVFYKSCHLIERVVLSDPALSQRALSYGLRDMSTNISLFGFVVNFHKYVLFCWLASIYKERFQSRPLTDKQLLME